ncbi:MAG: hypothetical protein J0I54_15975 [Bosea sp.]|uniref:hypothetical protein n=1 Tax=unclassified Bosea (in: a-proteobacteria) TaxID=2653178 RepID=UPI000960F6D0|nr:MULTISPECIES: hypothetical protein [unclassified Bosea (in: a-proteobacteria)]MBN9458131.1 hypothetical protein [Bosea sp. (in: a-proteobacteria)]OJV10627.1 MAG: hypothetical protein BGO20_07875 [Bosea sp. 67-29]
MSTLANEDDGWLDQVRGGDFASIPHAPTWLQSARLAHLLNGYATSIDVGLGNLHGWANKRADEAARIGSWRGTALELWLCLFYEHRRWRHFGCQPEGQDRELVARLWRQLRGELQIAGDNECAIILVQIAAGSAKMR